MPDSISIQTRGFERLVKKLEKLPVKVQKKVVRPALNVAASPLVSAAKKNLPRSRAGKTSGLLRKSIGKKVWIGRRTGIVAAFIGPRKQTIGEFEGRKRWPIKYAHLVEFGTRFAAARPFLRPAWDRNKSRVQRIIRGRLRAGIIKEASKGN